MLRPVVGFHAHDGQDHLGRDSKLGGHAVDERAVGAPEFHAAVDAGVAHEDLPVFVPGLGLGRPCDRVDDRLLVLGAVDGAAHVFDIETVVVGQLAREFIGPGWDADAPDAIAAIAARMRQADKERTRAFNLLIMGRTPVSK